MIDIPYLSEKYTPHMKTSAKLSSIKDFPYRFLEVTYVILEMILKSKDVDHTLHKPHPVMTWNLKEGTDYYDLASS